MGLPYMTNGRFMITILALLILTVVGTPSTQRFFHSTVFLEAERVAWAQTETEIFPNSTSPAVLGNRSLIPGIHVMSLVHDVNQTWLIISSDNELCVNIRYNVFGN